MLMSCFVSNSTLKIRTIVNLNLEMARGFILSPTGYDYLPESTYCPSRNNTCLSAKNFLSTPASYYGSVDKTAAGAWLSLRRLK